MLVELLVFEKFLLVVDLLRYPFLQYHSILVLNIIFYVNLGQFLKLPYTQVCLFHHYRGFGSLM